MKNCPCGRRSQANSANRTLDGAIAVLHTNYQVTEQVELFGLAQNVFDRRYATFGTVSPAGLGPAVQVAGCGCGSRTLNRLSAASVEPSAP